MNRNSEIGKGGEKKEEVRNGGNEDEWGNGRGKNRIREEEENGRMKTNGEIGR